MKDKIKEFFESGIALITRNVRTFTLDEIRKHDAEVRHQVLLEVKILDDAERALIRREALDEAIRDIRANANKIKGYWNSELSCVRGALLGIVENVTHLRDNPPKQAEKGGDGK